MKHFKETFGDIYREMSKVSWPKKTELVRNTITVLSIVVFLSFFFTVIDLGISKLIQLVLE